MAVPLSDIGAEVGCWRLVGYDATHTEQEAGGGCSRKEWVMTR